MSEISPRTNSPFIIGVAGGSGSGKTTVVKNLIDVLKGTSTVVLHHDNYYRDQSHLPLEERVKTNYDHPNSLETSLLVEHLKLLSEGKSILEPTYDFLNHTRSQETISIQPAQVILVEGILIFDDPALRELCNLKVFVDTDDDIRLIRRIQRDTTERGRSLDNVIEQYLNTVRPMYQQFVEPSKRFADVIIPEGGFNRVALDLLLARVREVLLFQK